MEEIEYEDKIQEMCKSKAICDLVNSEGMILSVKKCNDGLPWIEWNLSEDKIAKILYFRTEPGALIGYLKGKYNLLTLAEISPEQELYGIKSDKQVYDVVSVSKLHSLSIDSLCNSIYPGNSNKQITEDHCNSIISEFVWKAG